MAEFDPCNGNKDNWKRKHYYPALLSDYFRRTINTTVFLHFNIYITLRTYISLLISSKVEEWAE